MQEHAITESTLKIITKVRFFISYIHFCDAKINEIPDFFEKFPFVHLNIHFVHFSNRFFPYFAYRILTAFYSKLQNQITKKLIIIILYL